MTGTYSSPLRARRHKRCYARLRRALAPSSKGEATGASARILRRHAGACHRAGRRPDPSLGVHLGSRCELTYQVCSAILLSEVSAWPVVTKTSKPISRPATSPLRADYRTRLLFVVAGAGAAHPRGPHRRALDRDNLAEEIESAGREQFNKLVSALRVAMLHMLKWDHQPARRSRSWMLSIKQARLEMTDVLDDNPGLKPRVAEAID